MRTHTNRCKQMQPRGIRHFSCFTLAHHVYSKGKSNGLMFFESQPWTVSNSFHYKGFLFRARWEGFAIVAVLGHMSYIWQYAGLRKSFFVTMFLLTSFALRVSTLGTKKWFDMLCHGEICAHLVFQTQTSMRLGALELLI